MSFVMRYNEDSNVIYIFNRSVVIKREWIRQDNKEMAIVLTRIHDPEFMECKGRRSNKTETVWSARDQKHQLNSRTVTNIFSVQVNPPYNLIMSSLQLGRRLQTTHNHIHLLSSKTHV